MSNNDKGETSMTKRNAEKELSPGQHEELLGALEARFEKNMDRHKRLEWAKVQAKLEANAEKLRTGLIRLRLLQFQYTAFRIPLWRNQFFPETHFSSA